MKKSALVLAIIFSFIHGSSQKTILIDHYTLSPESAGEKLLIIEMPYGKADIIRISGDTEALKTAPEMFVDVICTDYPSHISLQDLNNSRLTTFFQKFPFIHRAHLEEVNFLRQTDGAEKENATTMFHGLVVRYRPTQSAASMKTEIADLDRMLETIMESDTIAKVDSVPGKKERDSVIIQKLRSKKGYVPKNTGPIKYESRPWDMTATGYDRVRRSPLDSSLMITPKEAYKKGLITKAAFKAYDWTPWVTLFFRRIGDTSSRIITSVTVRKELLTELPTIKLPMPVPDSTLLKIFSRVTWKNFTVVEDVTVSMYPYSAQLLLWIKLHTIDSVTNRFIFFNDGNEMPDDEKEIGSTGGIYSKDCHSFNDVRKLVKEAMEKCSGGDRPENDIEALLTGEKEFPSSDFQVLIADNRAPIKDKILASKLRKPVRIILCGAEAYNVNVDYLNLARQTNGSVHLIEKDMYDLALLHEGSTIMIGQKSYNIKDGAFKETVAASD